MEAARWLSDYDVLVPGWHYINVVVPQASVTDYLRREPKKDVESGGNGVAGNDGALTYIPLGNLLISPS